MKKSRGRIPRVILRADFLEATAEDAAVVLGYMNRRVRVEKATLTTEKGLSRTVYAVTATGRRGR